MEWKDSNITLPLPKRNELTSLIEQNGVRMEVPAKKVFLKPGDTLNGVYYIAEGRTRHFMCAPDGAEKLLYTLSAGWFYGYARGDRGALPRCFQKRKSLRCCT